MSALHAYLTGIAVNRDPEAESVEHATAKLGIGYGERFGEAWERVKDLAGVVDVDRRVCAARVVKLGKRGLELSRSALSVSTRQRTRRTTAPRAGHAAGAVGRQRRGQGSRLKLE